MDVTELKDREADLQMQERENSRLLANEAVSGQFLEVRAPYRADLVDISREAVLRLSLDIFSAIAPFPTNSTVLTFGSFSV